MSPDKFTGHAIKPNHSTALPRYLISFDTETLPIKPSPESKYNVHKFRLGVALSVRYRECEARDKKAFRFTDPRTFWSWLYRQTKSNYTTWVVAHNAMFDLRVTDFAREMAESRMVLDAPRRKRDTSKAADDDTHAYGLACIDGPPTIIGCRCVETNGRIVFVDTLNWIKSGLSQIGQSVGLEKLQMPAFTAPDSSWFTYCERDAEIVQAAMLEIIRYVKEHDFGMFRYTAAGQAMSAYRHKYMRTKIFVHDDMEAKELERRSYYGGRTEVFKMGRLDCDIYQLDVNSLFPSIMATQQVPIRIERYHPAAEMTLDLPDINWGRSIADVCVKAVRGEYPRRTSEGTIYPKGAFRTTLAGQELREAIDHHEVIGIASWAEYDCATVFREYVTELWAIRKGWQDCGNVMFARLTKTLLNSLYGKFGQKTEKWTYRPDMFPPTAWHQWTVANMVDGGTDQFRSLGYHVFQNTGKLERPQSFPAICAFITAAARLRMNTLRKIAGPRNVFYQATDSLMVNKCGLDNLVAADEVNNNALGKLRFEHLANWGIIHGCNDYQLGDKLVISGVCGRHERVDYDTYRHRKYSALEGLFSSDPLPEVVEAESLWRRWGLYDKGLVGADGWVSPRDLDEDFNDGHGWANALSTAN